MTGGTPSRRIILSVRGVSAGYESRRLGLFGRKVRKSVLQDINLEVREGEFFGLLGESGCGKTTLAQCILGLIPFQGEIRIDGLRQEGRRRREMALKVSGVFQDPSGALNPSMRIGRILEEPLRVHRLGDPREREKRVDEILRLVGLDPSYKHRGVSELSPGQKQRVSIGCALMLGPRLLVADEAVSALDVSVGAQILNLLRELHEKTGLSLFFISHDLDVISYLCDRAVLMQDGRLVDF
jgi:ABC-type glutathione transport system ATPase component